MKIGLITNFERDGGLSFTRKLLGFLSDRGCEVLADERLGLSLGLAPCENIYALSDVLIVLGGDGTILRVARHAAVYKTPIFGINLGNLGYLASAEPSEWQLAVSKVLEGDHTLEKRMMLKVTNEEGDEALCLNDVYIRNSNAAHMISLRLCINGQYADTYRGDGIVLASPTGSTAYSLSAGGPVLKPDTSLISVTQISPHNLYARPFVLSGEDVVSITALKEQEGTVFADGEKWLDLKQGERISIRGADVYTYIIKTSSLGFYDILRRKMVEQREV